MSLLRYCGNCNQRRYLVVKCETCGAIIDDIHVEREGFNAQKTDSPNPEDRNPNVVGDNQITPHDLWDGFDSRTPSITSPLFDRLRIFNLHRRVLDLERSHNPTPEKRVFHFPVSFTGHHAGCHATQGLQKSGYCSICGGFIG